MEISTSMKNLKKFMEIYENCNDGKGKQKNKGLQIEIEFDVKIEWKIFENM